ncbi:MAG: NapC/NirT family cytochrome c [Xanthomonadales bacterium]|nr:NapC/NirT family cytochrome c [Xanthomonadales bacterium]
MITSKSKPRFLSRKIMLGSSVGAALFFMLVGVIFWGGFNTAMEATNTMEFCISCHEMEDNVYEEYKETKHFLNRSGVRASCSDCHVPDPWVHKVVRKIKASKELLHKALGTIDTPEKFDAHRLVMARRVWSAMKSTDSRECRNCHDFDSMEPEDQKKRSVKQHLAGMQSGNTCIDCHKGIAHTKVHDKLTEEELDQLALPNPDLIGRPLAPQWQALLDAENNSTGKPAKATLVPVVQPEAPVDAVDESAAESAAQAPASTPDNETETAVQLPATVDTQATTATVTDSVAPVALPASSKEIAWGGIEATEVVLFYPGQSSMEWMLKGSDHGGKRAFTKGDRCVECHEGEEVDIGNLIISGEKLEPTPIAGKRGYINLNIQAAHDKEFLYMRFQWQNTEHVAIPFADGGKLDPDNQIKLALMLATDNEDDPKVEYAERAGCWQSCHQDNNDMPDQPDKASLTGSPLAARLDLSHGVTKYLKESRTAIEIEGRDGKARGGWDKLKTADEIQAALENGSFMDLLRYKSGTGESEDGYILAERVMTGGQGVSFNGELKDGVWTVEMVRKLTSDQPGDISMALDQWYNIGFAIHDDYSNSRFHHVSLGFKLGFDDEGAEINALAQ